MREARLVNNSERVLFCNEPMLSDSSVIAKNIVTLLLLLRLLLLALVEKRMFSALDDFACA